MTVTECPACEAPVEIKLTEVMPGDCVVCSECDEALTVVTVKPLELAIEDDEDDFDDDGEDDEDDDLDDDEAEIDDDFDEDE